MPTIGDSRKSHGVYFSRLCVAIGFGSYYHLECAISHTPHDNWTRPMAARGLCGLGVFIGSIEQKSSDYRPWHVEERLSGYWLWANESKPDSFVEHGGHGRGLKNGLTGVT